MNWNSFLSTLLGAFVSFGAILLTNKLDLRKRKRTHDKLIRALMHGLQDELNGLLELTKSGPTDPLQTLPDGQPYEVIFNISQDYFTVYHANAALVMQIEDDSLRRTIFQTYTLAKMTLDGFRINQSCLERYHYLQSTFYKTKEASVRADYEDYRRKLVEIAARLKVVQREFRTSAAHLVGMLAEKCASAKALQGSSGEGNFSDEGLR